MAPRKIRLHIDELVLTGFEPRDRHAIADALRDRLLARMSDGATPEGMLESRAIESLDGGAIFAEKRAARDIGTGAADSVYGAIAGAGPMDQKKR